MKPCGIKAAEYADVLARRKRPLIMLMTCIIENAKFKKPAKSRLAVKPIGHPQKRAPGGVADKAAFVHWAFMTKARAFEVSVHKVFTPVSQNEPPFNVVGSLAIVHELLI